MELKIEYLPIKDLKPYEKNTRKHDVKDIEAIKASIKMFGFDDPVGVWKDTIVEGHGRWQAAAELGMETIPCIRLDHLTDEERRAYAIAHNKTAEQSAWDNIALGDELRDLLPEIDMTEFGFGDFEIAMLTEDMEPEPFDDDVIKKYEKHGESFLAKKRVIIVYTEDDEDALKALLGLEDIRKVVYDITELA